MWETLFCLSRGVGRGGVGDGGFLAGRGALHYNVVLIDSRETWSFDQNV